MIILPENTKFILNRLAEKGYEAFIVGGCVRDCILNRTPNDWDVCTNALPGEISDCFSDYKLITNGIKHGTVGVIINGDVTEITTYRIDGEYSDNRHPEQVEFSSSLKADASRRDFTVNAMAYNPDKGLIDYFGGIDDINKKIIRCVGTPDDRFREDALRILRAIRFSSKLGFTIEAETAKSIHKNKMLLTNISAERIRVEFEGIINGIKATKIFSEYNDVFRVFIPELPTENKFIFDYDAPELRRAYFYSHFENPKEIMLRLKYSKAEIKAVEAVKNYRTDKFEHSKPFIKKMLRKIGKEHLINFIKLKYPDNNSEIIKLINTASMECYLPEQLDIDGNDLIKLGYKGKEIKEKLELLLEAVIYEKCENKKENLLKNIDIF